MSETVRDFESVRDNSETSKLSQIKDWTSGKLKSLMSIDSKNISNSKEQLEKNKENIKIHNGNIDSDFDLNYQYPKILSGDLDLRDIKQLPKGAQLPKIIKGDLRLDSLERRPEDLEGPERVDGNVEIGDIQNWNDDIADMFENMSLENGKHIEEKLKDLEEEKEITDKHIKQHTLVAGSIALAPLPGADAIFLIGNEIKMFDSILDNYNLKKQLSASMLIKKMGIKVGVTRLGKKVASSLLQLFPGVGTAINTGVAMSMTYAVGLAISEICYKVKKAKITGDEEQISNLQNNFEEVAKSIYETKYKQAEKEFDNAKTGDEDFEEEYINIA